MTPYSRRRPQVPDPEPAKPTPSPSPVKKRARSRRNAHFVIDYRWRPIGGGPDSWGQWVNYWRSRSYVSLRAAEDALDTFKAQGSLCVLGAGWPKKDRLMPYFHRYGTSPPTHEVEYRVRDLRALESIE